MCRFVWLILLLVLSGITSVCRSDEPAFRELLAKIRPMSPAQALAAFQVQSGFRVELVVAEPMVQDPIAIDWGPDGRLWVVEMGGYPSGGEATGSGDSSGCREVDRFAILKMSMGTVNMTAQPFFWTA